MSSAYFKQNDNRSSTFDRLVFNSFRVLESNIAGRQKIDQRQSFGERVQRFNKVVASLHRILQQEEENLRRNRFSRSHSEMQTRE